MTAVVASGPYKGLTPYEEADAALFFGREGDVDIIVANLLSSRLTLLYGPSGVGKSSVLNAGVVHQLRQLDGADAARSRAPEHVAVVFNTWASDPVVGLRSAVQRALEDAVGGPLPEPRGPGLVNALEDWTCERRCGGADGAGRFGGEILLILDQFEEYALYHPNEAGEGTFAEEFPRLLSHRVERVVEASALSDGGLGAGAAPEPLRVNVLLAFREDHLAHLDRFKGRIPGLFSNCLRLDYLTLAAARSAVTEPVRVYNEALTASAMDAAPPPIEVEDALVEEVLNAVQTGRLTITEGGRGSVDPALGSDSPPPQEGDARVDTPFLQLVMTRVWEREMELESRTLRVSTFRDDLGGAEAIVRSHLQKALDALGPDQKDVAAAVFDHLVTPSGTKIAHPVPHLAHWAERSEAEVTSLLEALAGGQRRILRYIERAGDRPLYEIYHDRLAPAVLDWRTRYLEESQRRTDQRRSVKKVMLAVAVAIPLISVGGLWVNSLHDRAEADRVRNETLEKQQGQYERALEAIRRLGVATTPDNRYIAAVVEPGGRLRVTDTRTFDEVRLPTNLTQITAAAFDTSSFGGGQAGVIATGHADHSVQTWTFPDFRRTARYPSGTGPRHAGRVSAIAFSPHGLHLVTASSDSTAMVWRTADSALIEVQHFDRPIEAVSRLRYTPTGIQLTALGPEGEPAGRCRDNVYVKSDRSDQVVGSVLTQLAELGEVPTVYEIRAQGQMPWRVAIGPFCSRGKAEQAKRRLQERGTWGRGRRGPSVEDVTRSCPRPVYQRAWEGSETPVFLCLPAEGDGTHPDSHGR